MEKYTRLITVSGRTFATSETMADIFLAHVSDILARGLTELVPLLHEGGVDMLLVSSSTPISVVQAGPVSVPTIEPSRSVVTAA
jgi:hypothetical protein